MPRRRKKARTSKQNGTFTEHDDENMATKFDAGDLLAPTSVENGDDTLSEKEEVELEEEDFVEEEKEEEGEEYGSSEVNVDTMKSLLRYDTTSNPLRSDPRGQREKKYTGISSRSLRRKHSALIKAAMGNTTITDIFPTEQNNKTKSVKSSLPLSNPGAVESAKKGTPAVSYRQPQPIQSFFLKLPKEPRKLEPIEPPAPLSSSAAASKAKTSVISEDLESQSLPYSADEDSLSDTSEGKSDSELAVNTGKRRFYAEGRGLRTPRQYLTEIKTLIKTMEHAIKLKACINPHGTYQTLLHAKEIQAFYESLEKHSHHGRSYTAARVADVINTGSQWSSRVLAKHVKRFEETGVVPASRRGRHSKIYSIIKEEDVLAKIWQWIRTDKTTKRGFSSYQFISFVNATFQTSISSRCASDWLRNELKLDFDSNKKGFFHDGHERGDVRLYVHTFIPRFLKYMSLMTKYDVTGEPILPVLKAGEKKHVQVTHDESTFHSNDDSIKMWSELGKKPPPKKDRGQGVMVSEFLTAELGPLVSAPSLPVWDSKATSIDNIFWGRFTQLEKCKDARAVLVTQLIKRGYKWAGNSLITFLGQGVEEFMSYLNKPVSGDIDLYRTNEEICDISENMLTHADFGSGAWKIDEKKRSWDVDKLKLTHKRPKVNLTLDQVNVLGEPLPSGTDLWANLYVGFRSGTYYYELFRSGIGPNIQITIRNALNYGNGAPVDCFVLRKDIMPAYDYTGTFKQDESNVDGRFRSKLHGRKQDGRCRLVPCWPATPVRVMIQPGKHKDDYWGTQTMAAQTVEAVNAFEIMAPGCVAVFCFDCSTGHTGFAPDALNANVLLVGDFSDAKKIPSPSRKGWFLRDGKRVEQDMNVDTPSGIQRKGMESILKERGLWRNGLIGHCKTCASESARGFQGLADDGRRNCCMRKILLNEPDFLEQKPLIEEYITSRGHICVFYPKFHCELNFIELFWGYIKRKLRAACGYTLPNLLRLLEQFLTSVGNDLPLLRRMQRHTFRYCYSNIFTIYLLVN